MRKLSVYCMLAAAAFNVFFDANVSRAKGRKTTTSNTSVVSEERYPGQYHHVDVGNVVEDYIYLNGEKIGVVKNGTQLEFPLYDHVGSPTVLTDAAGQAVEYVDYEPFGTEAVQQSLQPLSSDRGFLDKEVDEQTSLQYFGARYYTDHLARFSSGDPLLRDPARMGRILIDPQQLNGYAYGRGNPLSFVDPSGEKVELIRRPVFDEVPLGAHSFVLITNSQEDAAKLKDIPGVSDKTRITFGGYIYGNKFFGDLVKDVNRAAPGDSIADFDRPDSQYISRTVITKPGQYETQNDFENAVIQSYLDLPDRFGAYSFLAHPIYPHQANSNNVASTVLLNAGVPKSELVRGLSSWDTTLTPGLGTAVPNRQAVSAQTQYRVARYLAQRALTGLSARQIVRALFNR